MIPRAATEADLPAAAAILSDWVAVTPWMPKLHGRDEDLAWLAGLHQRGVVCVAGDPVQGLLGRLEGDVQALFVASHARHRGIGRALIAGAQAAVPHLVLWTFQANAAARGFYAAVGFDEVEWTDGAGNEEALPDVRLEWRRA